MAAGQPRAPPPGRQRVEQQPESDNEDVKVKEEEQTLGQLRDQLTRLPAPGPRAARVLIKIEDSKIGEDMDGSGDAEQEAAGEEVEEHQAEQTQAEAGVDVMAPVPRRARLPPGSYADLVVERDTDDDYEEEEEEEDADDEEDDDEEEDEEEEEEEGEQEGEDAGINVSGGAASWEANDRRSSQVAGVQWIQKKKQWEARHTVDGKRVNLGCHATKEAASLAIDNCVKDHGVKPDELRVRTSQSEGVYWNKRRGNWRAECKGKNVGVHATEEAAARAYNKEAERLGLDDLHIIPPAGDAGNGSNTAAAAAATASALALPGPAAPARAHAGTGSKRAAPTSPAPPQSKTLRLDTSAALRQRHQQNQRRRHPQKQQRGGRHRWLASKLMRSSTATSSRLPATLMTAATLPPPPSPPPPFLAWSHMRARTPARAPNAPHRQHHRPLMRRRCGWTPRRARSPQPWPEQIQRRRHRRK